LFLQLLIPMGVRVPSGVDAVHRRTLFEPDSARWYLPEGSHGEKKGSFTAAMSWADVDARCWRAVYMDTWPNRPKVLRSRTK